MSVGYELINVTKKERISFTHLPVSTMREITGNPVSSAITTWYIFKNSGDKIGFVPDQCNKEVWPLKDISWKEIYNYLDLTEDIIKELIDNKILIDTGTELFDKDEPEIYIRRLKNIWLD